jgi:hypothetical protein
MIRSTTIARVSDGPIPSACHSDEQVYPWQPRWTTSRSVSLQFLHAALLLFPFSVLCWDSLQSESELAEYKKQAKLIFRKLNENSEERASIESGPYFLQYFPSSSLLSSLSSSPPFPLSHPRCFLQYAYTNSATSSTRQSAT